MDTDRIPDAAPSNWIPMTSAHDIALIGKLGEEAAELAAKCCRTIIQGIDGLDPESGKPNGLAIADEIADVMALAGLVMSYFPIDKDKLNRRVALKTEFKRPWFDALEERDRVRRQQEL